MVLLGALLSFVLPANFSFGSEDATAITGLSFPSVGATRASEPVLASAVLVDTVRREEMAEGLAILSGDAAVSADVDKPSRLDLYKLYTVRTGDTASAIAARFGVDLQYLLWANPDLRDGELLTIGQMLVVPSGNGLLHHLRYGETLSDIAARYGVTVESIMAWDGNGIGSADEVLEEATLFVPAGVPPVTILPEPTPEPANEPVFVEAPAPAPAPPAPAAPPVEAPAPAQPAGGSGLIWPVYGPISSYMDYSHPLGIDIDMYNNAGAPIAAATSGTVTFAGGDSCCSYGLYVIILSPAGIETLYAHLSSFAVSAGDQVSQGATLGYGGCTGYCTGSHLHFEVIDNGVRVNPLSYLP
jgi:murein DD-endopeptidase MepM/ murein hydrolase activator NlpD